MNRHSLNPINVGKRISQMETTQKVKSGVKNGVKKVGSGASTLWQDFRHFINRGNVVDLAVGLVAGAAFTSVVNSFVSDLVSPIIGLLFQVNLSNAYLPIQCKNAWIANVTVNCKDIRAVTSRYPTPTIANANGIVTFNYGNFTQQCINFLIVSIILFFFVKAYAAAFRRKFVPDTKPCTFCCKEIPTKASRCPECTSMVLDDLEEEQTPLNSASSSSSIETKIRM